MALVALVVVGLAVLAWAAIRPGPMDFAGSTVALSEYDGDPTGVPADFESTDAIARGQYLAEASRLPGLPHGRGWSGVRRRPRLRHGVRYDLFVEHQPRPRDRDR